MNSLLLTPTDLASKKPSAGAERYAREKFFPEVRRRVRLSPKDRLNEDLRLMLEQKTRAQAEHTAWQVVQKNITSLRTMPLVRELFDLLCEEAAPYVWGGHLAEDVEWVNTHLGLNAPSKEEVKRSLATQIPGVLQNLMREEEFSTWDNIPFQDAMHTLGQDVLTQFLTPRLLKADQDELLVKLSQGYPEKFTRQLVKARTKPVFTTTTISEALHRPGLAHETLLRVAARDLVVPLPYKRWLHDEVMLHAYDQDAVREYQSTPRYRALKRKRLKRRALASGIEWKKLHEADDRFWMRHSGVWGEVPVLSLHRYEGEKLGFVQVMAMNVSKDGRSASIDL